jgi:membrane-associated phospholipid phosphatase
LRKRLRWPPAAVLGGAALAPLSAAVLVPRGARRAALVSLLQMHAYVAAYKMPHDDERAHARSVHVDYPLRADRVLGLGELPTARLQRALHPDGWFRGYEKVLVWAHWVWFATPHATLAYIFWRDRRRFTRAAVLTYAVFDVGVVTYWVLPTAPPWYAAQAGRAGAASGPVRVRRLMVEYGEGFWRENWDTLYAALGGNPLAAMPSLHFATACMGALLLAESGPRAGAVGGAYAAVLGFALVYLGEHYVVDLLGGLALTLAVRRSERLARRPLRAAGRLIDRAARFANALPAPRADAAAERPPIVEQPSPRSRRGVASALQSWYYTK